MIVSLEILIVVEFAVALQQPEAARVFIGKRGDPHFVRVDERPPEPFAAAALQQEAVGIVHFRTEIPVRGPRVLTVPEHAGQRRQPDHLDLGPPVDGGADRGHGLWPGLDVKTVGARDAWAVQERKNHEFAGICRRFLHPELLEQGEFLAIGFSRVDREPARR